MANNKHMLIRGRTVLIFLILLGSTFCLAQEITQLKQIARLPYPFTSPVPPFFNNEMYQHNGKFYWMIGNVDNRFNDLIEELDIHEFDYAVNPNDLSEIRRAKILLEYTPGEGFTDYVLFNHGWGQDQILSFDGDNLLVVSNSAYLAIQDSVIVGHIDSTFIEYPNFPTRYFTYVVYDMKSDTFVSTYSEIQNDYNVTAAGLQGDYIYTVSFNFFDYSFMGDTLDLFVPDDFYSSNTHLSKINHKKAEKEWSYHMADTAFGSFAYKALQIRFDEEGNAIIVFRPGEPSQYKGEFINEMYGINDLEFYKIDPDGTLLNHQRVHGSFDDLFRDYKMNDDGSIDIFGRTRYPQFISIENDTFDIEHEDVTAFALHLDKDWNVKWVKSIPGSLSTSIVGMNSYNGESILSVILEDTLYLADTILINPYIGDTSTIYSKRVEVILKYNEAGERIGDPLIYGYGSFFYELFQIDQDHYFFFAKGDKNYPTFEFLGADLGLIHQEYYVLIEIEGDLFDAITSMNTLQVSDNGAKLFPNPVTVGQEIMLKIPERIMGQKIYLKIINSIGRLEFETKIDGDAQEILIKTKDLIPGQKYLIIQSESYKTTKSIIIH